MPASWFEEIDGGPYAAWWKERFGVPDADLEGLRFYRRGRSLVWVGTADVSAMHGSRTDAVGVPMLRLGSRLWKPTSTAIVTLAGAATRNVIDLEDDEMETFLAGQDRPLDDEDPRRAALSDGYVAVRYSGVAVGCGEWRGGVLRSCVPKGRRIERVLTPTV